MEDIDRTIRIMQGLGKRQDATLTQTAGHVEGGSRNLSMSWAIGTRVFDLVTGQAGTVVNGKRESVIIPPA